MKPQAVVTGAGSGLGRELARQLAQQDWQVAALGRRAAPLEALAAEQPGIRPWPCDIAEPRAVAETFAALRAEAPVGMLIANAAIYPRRDFLQETAEEFGAVMAANFGGYLACAKEALTDMVALGRGRILNVSSFADLGPLPGSAAYSVSKGAGRLLTRALAAELGARFPQIVISDWIPGALATEMGLPGGIKPEVAAAWGVALAQMDDPGLTGTLWERDREVLPPASLKRRLAGALGIVPRRRPRQL